MIITVYMAIKYTKSVKKSVKTVFSIIHTVVGDFINTMRTIFDMNFYLNKSLQQQ